MSKARLDEPNMSDAAILITVEQIIDQAMGGRSTNKIDFKLLQLVLILLARHQRILQQKVEIRTSDYSSQDSKGGPGKDSEKSGKTGSTIKISADKKTGSHTRRGSRAIDVVTQSQFALLVANVDELRLIAPPPLALPDNERLRNDIASGAVTLPAAMEAMQVNARVKAAEGVIGRTIDILTRLAATSSMPADLMSQLDDMKSKVSPDQKVGAFGPQSAPRADMTSRASHGVVSLMPGVTRAEFEEIAQRICEDMAKKVDLATVRSGKSAEAALRMAQSVNDKMEEAENMESRISALNSVVADYSHQLSGFDAGLATQMQSFREQMAQIEGDMAAGLKQLENVNSNAETIAVAELTERHEELVAQLDETLNSHSALSTTQARLELELKGLVECVEMLREQKADRAEVEDGLRDKANASRLAGLLTAEKFNKVRINLEQRLSYCHDKFSKQNNVWMEALKDLTLKSDSKAQFFDLVTQRDEVQKELEALDDRLRVLAMVLGEPEAAMISRKLAVNALCGACRGHAWMSARPADAGVPPQLPALRPPPEPQKEPLHIGEADRDWSANANRHKCHRWCGGSHTLVTEHTIRERAPPPTAADVTTKSYLGCGIDGRMYMMSEELQLEPCVECNIVGGPGAGGKVRAEIAERVFDVKSVQDVL